MFGGETIAPGGYHLIPAADNYEAEGESMNMSRGIRQFHRWTSIVFVVLVILIFAMLGVGVEPPQAVYFLPLPPLFLLMATGLYMFFQPYLARRRGV
jgi:hypothetical protein